MEYNPQSVAFRPRYLTACNVTLDVKGRGSLFNVKLTCMIRACPKLTINANAVPKRVTNAGNRLRCIFKRPSPTNSIQTGFQAKRRRVGGHTG